MPIELIASDRAPSLLSVVIAAEPMCELLDTLSGARTGCDALAMPYEVICVTDGRDQGMMDALGALAADWPELLVLGLRPWTDDDAALSVALRRARGSLVLTLAGWPEVAPEDFARLPEALGDADIVLAVRRDLNSTAWQRWRRRRFGDVLAGLFGQRPSDPFCRTRLARRAVLEDVAEFGVRQHFVPVIAGQRGYLLTECEVRSAAGPAASAPRYVFSPLGHVRALFDAATLYVVLKFLRRPLRFFGSIGLPVFVIGSLTTLVLIAQRLSGDALSDRPALIFAVLMVVLGIQIIAIGLVGEIIIYANSRRMKQYAVREVIRQEVASRHDPDDGPSTAGAAQNRTAE